MSKNPIKETEQYYNQYHERWTSVKTNSFHWEKEFIKLVKLWPEKGSIIDIGCASGIHAPLFLGIGRHLKYTGIDISTGFLKTAQRRYPQLTFLKGDISEKNTLPKKKFDGFWAAAVLMHIPIEQWDDMFKNIFALLKPGAYGLISLPIAHPSGEAKNAADSRHFTILTEAKQIETLKKVGFKIKNKGSIDGTTSENVWRWYIVQAPTK